MPIKVHLWWKDFFCHRQPKNPHAFRWQYSRSNISFSFYHFVVVFRRGKERKHQQCWYPIPIQKWWIGMENERNVSFIFHANPPSLLGFGFQKKLGQKEKVRWNTQKPHISSYLVESLVIDVSNPSSSSLPSNINTHGKNEIRKIWRDHPSSNLSQDTNIETTF